MSAFALHTVHYSPGAETVTIAVRAADGPFAGKVHDVYTTQAALHARCPEGQPWGDEAVVAEAKARLEASGGTLLEPLLDPAKAIAA